MNSLSHEARSSPHDENGMRDLFQVVPIGFGISKLVMSCVLESDDLEVLVEAMEDELEGVQSVDVDWENTFPVADSRTFRLPPGV